MASSLTWGRRSKAPWRGLAALLLAACAALCPFVVEERASGQDALGAPTIDTVAITSVSLTVNWSAPSETGGSAITAYDVRYILTSVTDKAQERLALQRLRTPALKLERIRLICFMRDQIEQADVEIAVQSD